jgi:hypothetical protein
VYNAWMNASEHERLAASLSCSINVNHYVKIIQVSAQQNMWCEQKLLRFSCRTFKDGKDEVTENKQET